MENFFFFRLFDRKLGCIRPSVTNFPCHVIGSAPTAVGRFLLPDQLSGTHCLMTYVIRNVLQIFTDSR